MPRRDAPADTSPSSAGANRQQTPASTTLEVDLSHCFATDKARKRDTASKSSAIAAPPSASLAASASSVSELPGGLFAPRSGRSKQETPTSKPATPPPVSAATEGDDGLLATGSIIEKYRIEELLGTGGFAAVYRATHLLLKSPVAIKLLKPKLFRKNKYLAELLCEEARFAARLSHPNLVRVYDATHHPEITFIVMEYIRGQSLSARLHKRGPLAVAELLSIGIEVCHGLDAALDQGLIHRDIKPGNILLTDKSKVKIVDLGLACPTNADDWEGSNFRSGRWVVGTPAYMALEQAERPDEVDFRADIYALGATLYHAATGRPPYDCTELKQVSSTHEQNLIPNPDLLRPGFPPDVTRVLMWMLDDDPDARPSSYSQLVMGLEEALQALDFATTVQT